MTEQHPITPPPELKQKWHEEAAHRQYSVSETEDHLFEQAAQWGADQELEACCKWTTANFGELPGQNLHLFRRPKPPSLREQALLALSHLVKGADESMDTTEAAVYIRRALEALPDD